MYWITGLSGSGKTTLAKALLAEMEKDSDKVVFLDGDILRKYIFSDVGYSYEERLAAGLKYSGLCAMLADQGFSVICATVAMFDEVREKNRENIPNYFEIFLDVPPEILKKRNQKGLYTGQVANVIGRDIPPEFPKNPDLVFTNNHESPREGVEETVREVLRRSGWRGEHKSVLA